VRSLCSPNDQDHREREGRDISIPNNLLDDPESSLALQFPKTHNEEHEKREREEEKKERKEREKESVRAKRRREGEVR